MAEAIEGRDLTVEQAVESAEAMAGEHPPTNTAPIETHAQFWEEKYEKAVGEPVVRWYRLWCQRVNDGSYSLDKFDTAYVEFCETLRELGLSP